MLLFKILVLQTLYTLSDDAAEFQIRDLLSLMRFLRLGLEDPVPDAKTIWLFREQLTRSGAITELFADFDAWLKGQGYLAMSGQIVDASIIAAPRQRTIDAEKAALKERRIPQDWADRQACRKHCCWICEFVDWRPSRPARHIVMLGNASA